jgi:phosphomethylpyrimidine synthase
MKITQEVREYAAQKELDEKAAIEAGLQEKSEQFVQLGSELYTKA